MGALSSNFACSDKGIWVDLYTTGAHHFNFIGPNIKQLWDKTNRQYSKLKTVLLACFLRQRHYTITLAHAIIPAEGTDDVDGAPRVEGGASAAVTSAISCTHTQGKGRKERTAHEQSCHCQSSHCPLTGPHIHICQRNHSPVGSCRQSCLLGPGH